MVAGQSCVDVCPVRSLGSARYRPVPARVPRLELTARVAQAGNPGGMTAAWVRDRLGGLRDADQFPVLALARLEEAGTDAALLASRQLNRSDHDSRQSQVQGLPRNI